MLLNSLIQLYNAGAVTPVRDLVYSLTEACFLKWSAAQAGL